ncbi:MAG TPA: YIP1 family protein [Gemmatimonadaceae bacterium]
MTVPANTPAAPQASLWEDFIDIFSSPSAVFRRRENSGFGMQLLIVTVLFIIIFLGTKSLIQPVFDAEMARQTAQLLKAHPEITADKIQGQMAMGAKLAPFFIIVVIPISIMLTGLVLWVVGKIFESKQSVQTGIMVATYAFAPRILGVVAGAVIAYFSNPDRLNGAGRITLGLGALMDPDTTSPALLALLTRIDVFTIWQTILIAIGLQVTGKLSKTNSYIAAGLVWLIGALPTVLGALRR